MFSLKPAHQQLSALLAAALLTVTTSLPAQDITIPAEAKAAAAAVRPEAIRAHMTFIADDVMEGRKPGTRGYTLIANYVKAQFEALGLKPAGENNTYLQKVPLRQWQVDEQKSNLQIQTKSGERTLVYGKNFILSPNFNQPSADVSAPVVFVGFGVSAPELGYDDYKGIDVKGKIVAYFNGAPTSFPSNQRAFYSSSKPENAAAHGAVGVITFSLPSDVRARVESAAPRARQGVFKWMDNQGNAQRTFPQLIGSASFSDSTARSLFTGTAKNFEEAVAIAHRNTPQAFPLNATVRMHTETLSPQTIMGYNVIGLLPGSDPVLKNEYVVYVCHLDHLGIGRPVKGDSIYNGAHDNASGISINLEAARLFTLLPKAPKRSILFVGVTGEEMGLLGSDYFASNPTVPKDKMVANLTLDMPFFFHPLLDIVPYGAQHSSLNNEVSAAAKYLGIEVSPDPMPEQVVFMRSDHFSFVRQGIPALFVKSGSKTGNPQLDGLKLNLDWRATIYHSPQDDMNQPFDFAAAAKHVQLQFLIGYLTSQSPTRPTWNKDDFFGNKFGTARQ